MTLVLLLGIAVVVLGAVLVAQRHRIHELEAELAGDADPDRPAGTGRHRPDEVIAIHIRNHGDLAASRTSLARPLGRVAPGLLRSIVHRETLKELRTQLVAQGVDADVRLRRLPPRAAAPEVPDPTPAPDPGDASDLDRSGHDVDDA